MASSICSSSSIANIQVSRISVLDIINNEKNEWKYVIDVVWSDFRQHKIHRGFDEIISFQTRIRKLLSSNSHLKEQYLQNIPKIPGRGFFSRKGIKLYVQKQLVVDNFFRFVIRLPTQVSGLTDVLDFFERKDDDPDVVPIISQSMHSLHHISDRGRIYSIESMGGDICESASVIGLTQSTFDADSAVSGYSSDSASSKNDGENRINIPPSFLPVTSCFESDDDEGVVTEYQKLLEDVTAFDFHALPRQSNDSSMHEKPSVPESFEMEFDLSVTTSINSALSPISGKTDEENIRESKDIISPYSPNKLYFHIVDIPDNMETT